MSDIKEMLRCPKVSLIIYIPFLKHVGLKNLVKYYKRKKYELLSGLPLTYSTFSFVLGLLVSQEALIEVAEISGVLTAGDYFLAPNIRAECERISPDVDSVKACDAADTFLFLKRQYHDNQYTLAKLQLS